MLSAEVFQSMSRGLRKDLLLLFFRVFKLKENMFFPSASSSMFILCMQRFI